VVTPPRQSRGADGNQTILYPLTFVDEGDQVVIGRPDVDSFAIFPADAAAVVRRLAIGADIASVATWYQAMYGEPADIEDFVDTLRDLGFVRPEGEVPAEIPPRPPVRWQRLGIILLSPPALAAYALAIGATIYLMVSVPALHPGPSKVFFTKSVLVVMGATCAAQLVGIAVHEGFHVLAGRRLGLPSRLSVGRRLYFVVFQTTLVGLMGVPARKRILPFCAGLIADCVLTACLVGLAEASRLAGWPPWTVRVAVAFVYVTILRMLWQAMIFMETDLYYLLASALRCHDLHAMTRTYLRTMIARLRGQRGRGPVARPGPFAPGWTDRDLRIVRYYAPVVVVGSIVVILLAAVSTIPVLASLAARIYHGIAAGDFASPWFWDSLATGAAILSQFAVAAVLAILDRRRARGRGLTVPDSA
jgi:hypothetical protein